MPAHTASSPSTLSSRELNQDVGRAKPAALQGPVFLTDRGKPSHAAQVARRCAQHHLPDPRSERDAPIAAAALLHAMTVVTRNTADLEGNGVPLINPWIRA